MQVTSENRKRTRAASSRTLKALSLAAVPMVCLIPSQAGAAAKVWVGGTDGNWATGANWSPSALNATGDTLTFNAAGVAGYSLTDDFSGLSVGNITFSASGTAGYNVAGGAGVSLTLTATSFTNNSSFVQTFSVPILLNNPAPLTFSGGAGVTFNGLVTVSGANRTITNSLTAGTLTYGAINLSESNTGRGIIFGGTGATAITGIIADGGSGAGFLSSGATSLTLSAANTYTGGTSITGGVLKVSGSGTLGNISGTLAINNAGSLDLNGTNQTVGNFSGNNAGASIVNNNSGTSTLTIGNGNTGGGTFLGVIKDNNNAGTGKVALIKTGTGAITLSAGNTFTGGTTVNQGTLALAGAFSNEIRTSLTIGDGTNTAALTFDATPQSTRISSTAVVTINTNGSLNINGTANVINTININGGLLDIGGGTLTQSSTSPASTLTMTGGTMQNGTFAFTGASGGANIITINASATKSLISSSVNLLGFAAPVVVADGAVVTDFEISGVVSSTNVGLTKSGLGVMALTNSAGNQYGGITTVTSGTLLVSSTSGSATGKSIVQVGAGATLAGTGSVGGLIATSHVTLAGSGTTVSSTAANLSPGALDGNGNSTIGKLTIGSTSFNNNLVFGTNSRLTLQLSGALNDSVEVDGNLDLSGANDTLVLSPANPFTTGTYSLVKYTGTLVSNGFFNNVIYDGTAYTSGSLPTFLTIDYGTGTNSTISLTVTSVPEPASFGLLCGAMATASLRRRRTVRPIAF